MVALAASGCATAKLPPAPLTADIEAIAQDAVRSRMRDPASAQFKALRAGTDRDGATVVCGVVNARNGFGGYAGPSAFHVRIISGTASPPTIDSNGSLGLAFGWCVANGLT